MGHQFNHQSPIYVQLCDIFKKDIAMGRLAPGDRIPTVRKISVEYRVNPNTVQRALTELEKEGLAFSKGTSGRFVTTDTTVIKRFQKEKAKEAITEFIRDMKILQYHKADVIQVINDYWEVDS